MATAKQNVQEVFDFTIYEPSEREDPFVQYPELKNVPEFAELTADELRFTWWHSNPTSPFFFYVNNYTRTNAAYRKVFVKGKAVTPKQEEQLAAWLSCLPDHIQFACKRMEQCNPSVRKEAKEMLKEIFLKWKEISTAKIPKDLDDQKKHIDMTTDIIKGLPDLIAKLEMPFTVKMNEVNKIISTSVFDEVMNEEQEQFN